MTDIRVLAVQPDIVWEDREANLRLLEQMLSINRQPADLVVLPEFFATGFSPRMAELAEPPGGPTCKWMHHLAVATNAVVCGSVPTVTRRGVVNRFFWIAPDGQEVWYDKFHLFSVGGETTHLVRGESRVVITLGGWRFLPLVCYDLRFPVFSRNRFVNGKYDYDVLVYVANWPASRNYHWRTLMTARAIENQAFVVGVNRTGTDGTGLVHQGDSMIVDPKGNLAAFAADNSPQIISGNLGREELDAWRQKFPVAADWDQGVVQTIEKEILNFR